MAISTSRAQRAPDRAFTLPAVTGPALAALGLLFVVALALTPVEIDRAFSLPAHPLLLHVPVILVPLLVVASIALAVLPRWRDRLGVLWGAFAVVCLIATVLAVGSGEAFLEGRPFVDQVLRDHREAAETLRILTFGLTAAILVLLAVDWLRARAVGPAVLRTTGVALAVSALIVPLSLATGFFVIRTGHLGAKAAWSREGGQEGGGGSPPGG